jgi:Flp pilus assembly protein TadD
MNRVPLIVLSALLLSASAVAPRHAYADPVDDDQAAAQRDPDYRAGKAAIDKKNWAEAVKRFNQAALRDPSNADIQNYLGFAHRNLTAFDLAFKHYRRALELNPRHRGAHEYIGEAYLQVNDLPSAEKHLAQLRSICLLQCEELADLEKAVKEYRTRGGR